MMYWFCCADWLEISSQKMNLYHSIFGFEVGQRKWELEVVVTHRMVELEGEPGSGLDGVGRDDSGLDLVLDEVDDVECLWVGGLTVDVETIRRQNQPASVRRTKMARLVRWWWSKCVCVCESAFVQHSLPRTCNWKFTENPRTKSNIRGPNMQVLESITVIYTLKVPTHITIRGLGQCSHTIRSWTVKHVDLW